MENNKHYARSRDRKLLPALAWTFSMWLWVRLGVELLPRAWVRCMCEMYVCVGCVCGMGGKYYVMLTHSLGGRCMHQRGERERGGGQGDAYTYITRENGKGDRCSILVCYLAVCLSVCLSV